MQAKDQQLSANIFMHPSRQQTVLPSAHLSPSHTHTHTRYGKSLVTQNKYQEMKSACGEITCREM